MGQQIAREWGDHPGTIVRWMAHWIAELIERVDAAETDEERHMAQKRCAEAIQTLWMRRQHWPYGAPLQRVAAALNALVEEPSRFERDRPSPEAGWAGAIAEIERLGDEEWDIVRQAAIAELDLSAEKQVVETSPDALVEDERQIIERLLEWQERQRESYFKLGSVDASGFGDLALGARARLVEEALSSVAERRRRVLATAVATSLGAADGKSGDVE